MLFLPGVYIFCVLVPVPTFPAHFELLIHEIEFYLSGSFCLQAVRVDAVALHISLFVIYIAGVLFA